MLATAFKNAAPRFPEKVAVYLPKGARAAIERAAEKSGITASELLRCAIAEKLEPAASSETGAIPASRASSKENGQ